MIAQQIDLNPDLDIRDGISVNRYKVKSKVCFIIVSSPIERASRNSTYETPQLTQKFRIGILVKHRISAG